MTVDVQAINFGSSQPLFEHARRRLDASLDRFAQRIRRVSVKLEDENGPKGGQDMRCQIEVELDRHGRVIIEQHDSDPYVAVDRAADRAKRTVRRAIGRARARR